MEMQQKHSKNTLFWYTQHWEEQSSGKPFIQVWAVPAEQRQYFVIFEYNEALSDLLRMKWDHFRNQCAVRHAVLRTSQNHATSPLLRSSQMLPAPPNFNLSFATKFRGLKTIHQTLLIATTFLTIQPGVWICMGIKYHSVNGHSYRAKRAFTLECCSTHHILVPKSPNVTQYPFLTAHYKSIPAPPKASTRWCLSNTITSQHQSLDRLTTNTGHFVKKYNPSTCRSFQLFLPVILHVQYCQYLRSLHQSYPVGKFIGNSHLDACTPHGKAMTFSTMPRKTSGSGRKALDPAKSTHLRITCLSFLQCPDTKPGSSSIKYVYTVCLEHIPSNYWLNAYGMVWYGMVWYGMVWYGMVCMVWYGMVWYGMVWYGMVWYGMLC